MSSLRCVLDEAKRQRILALVANGSSRNVAARYVGCAASTIIRTAMRDPDFGVELARAEHTAEIALLRAIQAAGKMPQHSCAAAWLLERRNPEDFAPRPPLLMTEQEMADTLAQFAHIIHKDMSEEDYERALQKIDGVIIEARSAIKQRGALPYTPPPCDDHPAAAAPTHGHRIDVDPLDDASGDDSPYYGEPPQFDSDAAFPVSQFASATTPLEVEIDLCIDAQDIKCVPTIGSDFAQRPK